MSDCYFDQSEADKVVEWIESHCLQSKAPFANQPLKLTDWQKERIIYPLYGTFRNEKGPNGEKIRQYQKASIWTPKKNGKTTLIAALALYHLQEYLGSDCFCIASNVKQASILYEQSADFRDLNKELAEQLWVRRNLKKIVNEERKSQLSVLSSSPELSGFNAQFIALDEIAEWRGTNARIIYDRLANASMSRINSLQIIISTANVEKEHIGYEKFLEAQRLEANPELDATTLGVCYSLPIEDDWTDEEKWWAVNPSAGLTVPKEFYRNEFNKLKNNPQDESRFRTFLLNQYDVGSPDQWISPLLWKPCCKEFDESELYGSDAIVGFDMARKADLASYCIIVEKDDRYFLMPRFFIPGQIANQLEKQNKVPYRRWNKMGFIHFCNSDVIQPSEIRASLQSDSEHFQFGEIRYDEWGMFETAQILEEDFVMVPITQNYATLATPTNRFERLVRERKIVCYNPVFDWCLSNCQVKSDGFGRIMVDKKNSTGRIDGVVAAILGISYYLAESDEWTGNFVFA